MLINVFPVLHARTYNVDFRTGKLLVEPSFFTNEDSASIYTVALESTRQLEMAPSCGRYLVYGTDSYSVVGRTVRFSDLYTASNREPKYSVVDNANGRRAYGFVGLVFPKGTIDTPIVLSDDLMLDVYEHSIERRWEETESSNRVFETLKMDSFCVDVKCMNELPDYEPIIKRTSSPLILEDTEEFREQIVYNAMRQAFSGLKISLCTSLSKIEGGIFQIATCKNASTKVKELTKAIEFINSNTKKETAGSQYFAPKTTGSKSNSLAHNNAHTTDKTDTTVKKSNRERSLDDLLKKSGAPDDDESFQKHPRMDKENCYSDIGLVLGTILGITFIAIEVAKKSDPLLLILTSVCTLVVGGIEAKRIIDRFK